MPLQNASMISVACTALGDMAYVIPDVVLPLVHERYEVGLPHPCFWLHGALHMHFTKAAQHVLQQWIHGPSVVQVQRCRL